MAGRRSRLRAQPLSPRARSSNSIAFVLGACLLLAVMFVPIVWIEGMEKSSLTSAEVGVHRLWQSVVNMRGGFAGSSIPLVNNPVEMDQQAPVSDTGAETCRRSHVPTNLARGVAGRPMEKTPALQGAQRGSIECEDHDVSDLAYWNDPQGDRDNRFQTPFSASSTEEKYITFAPDRGGWNNVRMSMEIIFVIAAATNRTLVLPPKEPLYLMHHDKVDRYRGFGDFFPLKNPAFQKRVRTISMQEFLHMNVVDIPNDKKEAIMGAADHCDKRQASKAFCGPLVEFLGSVGTNPEIAADKTCLVFDEDVYHGLEPTTARAAWIKEVCGTKRNTVLWNQERNEPKVLHFHADEKQFRLLTHYYGMIKFSDPAIDNFYKRFVRDFLHYHDVIYCAAGKIVHALQDEACQRGFRPDEENRGGYSAMHIRRGDLQYKKVKIPAQEWYDNTKEVWKPKEILYIATDERNKTFFDDLRAHHDLRFLDDYWEMAGLKNLDPNYMGMVDTIIASRGRAFAGTWFSTFSGYINRLRGYQGFSMKDSWYSFLPRKTKVHEWNLMDDFAYAFEWPDGWVGIDADEFPPRDVF